MLFNSKINLSIVTIFTIAIISCSSIKKADNPPLPNLREEEQAIPEKKSELKSETSINEIDMLTITKIKQSTEDDLPGCSHICFHLIPNIKGTSIDSTTALIYKLHEYILHIETSIDLISKQNTLIRANLYGVSGLNIFPTWTIKVNEEESKKFVNGETYTLIHNEPLTPELKKFTFIKDLKVTYYK